MASSSSSSKKNVAVGKRAKIDSAQKHMLIFVGAASVLLGITIVAVIYFAKVISFNTKVIGAKGEVVEAYTKTQNSLKEISKVIAGLSTNEYLESVARMRGQDCKDFQTAVGETVKLSDLERVRECSALRVITDALPYTENQDTALTSFYILLILAKNGASIEHLGASEFEKSVVGDVTLSHMSITAEFNDSPESVMSSLKSIEKSIRNFDIQHASISYGKNDSEEPTLSVTASFYSYNATQAGLVNLKRTVCAKKDNEKCMAAGGDGYIQDLSEMGY